MPLTGANFRTDVDVSGMINGTDALTVKGNSGAGIP